MIQMFRQLALTLVLMLGLSAAVEAHAGAFRLPKEGAPAFVVDAAETWSATYDQYGNLQFLAADRSSDVQFSILSDPTLDTTPVSDIAAGIFQAAGAPPYTRSEQGWIAGRQGRAFIGVLTVNGLALDMRVVLVKLDASHYACLSTLRRQTITADQTEALNTLIAHARIADH
jgi:hypothetical protein